MRNNIIKNNNFISKKEQVGLSIVFREFPSPIVSIQSSQQIPRELAAFLQMKKPD